MTKSAEKFRNFAGIDTQVWGEALRRRRPGKTADLVAADIGLPARTIQNWLDGRASPNASGFTRMVLAYGPDFLAAVLPECPSWLDSAARIEKRAALAGEIARLEAELGARRP